MISDEGLARINKLRNTPMVVAARYNDMVVEGHNGQLDKAMAELRMPPVETLLHVATQRAMRVLQGHDAPEAAQTMIVAVILDALAIGWTAREFADNGVPAGELMPLLTKDDIEAFDAKMRGKK